MTVSKQNISRFILFGTVCILSIIAFDSYKKIHNLIDFTNGIQHTQDIQNSLERLYSLVKEAESSQRGFLLTDDSVYYDNFRASKAAIEESRIRARWLLQNDSIQKKRFDTLSVLLTERFNIMNYAVTMAGQITQPEQTERLANIIREGKITMDEVRSLIDKMQLHEKELLDAHNIEKIRLISLTPKLLFILSLFALILIIGSYFTIMRELNRRLEFEKELEHKINELNRSNSDLEQFAYVASHDLQEPLRKIRSLGDRLVVKYSTELNDDAQQTVGKMQNAAMRMQTLIDDLLSFSRLININEKFVKKDLNELLKDVLNDLEVILRSTNAKIHSGPLPSLRIVPTLIRQLFQNLISNSLKFSRPGVRPVISVASTIVKGIEIKEITQSALQEELFHKIEFTDNGIGFDEKYLDRIFVIFQRLHSKADYSGTGIGLAVSKRILAVHDGYITARSNLGEGSTFIIYLPLNSNSG
jgi:signal transduction histidine kinase